MDSDADADTATTTTTLLTPQSTFSHIQIWGHEQLPDVREDAFARGVGEWIRFAEMVSYFALFLSRISRHYSVARSEASCFVA
jgi:hypothetical protein